MIKNLSSKKKLQKKNSRNIPYSRFFIFIILLISLLVLGRLVEQNIKNRKVLGSETHKKESKPISLEIKEKTSKVASDLAKDAQNVIDNVLGEATKYITNTASSSADALTDYVFKNTVGSLLKQIDKLPGRQKEEIRKEICR